MVSSTLAIFVVLALSILSFSAICSSSFRISSFLNRLNVIIHSL